MITLAVETAICRGEIAKMRWEHYDRAGPTLKIPAANSKNRPRYVPLTGRAVSLLEGLSPLPRGSIFSYAPNGISQAFNEVCKRAGLEDLHFHDLRHEATSRFFEMGLDTMEVASITGHKTLQMLRRYTQLRAVKLAKKLV
jgi:integrase